MAGQHETGQHVQELGVKWDRKRCGCVRPAPNLEFGPFGPKRGAAFHPSSQALTKHDRLAERGPGTAWAGHDRAAQPLVLLPEPVRTLVASGRRSCLGQGVFFSCRARARSMLRG